MTEIIQPRDTVRLRPIGALDPATTSSDADLLLVEQAGTARKITRGDLLEDTETALLAYIDDNALSTSVDNTFTGDNTFSAPVSLTSAGAGAIIQPIPSEPGRLSFGRSGFVRFSIEHSVAGNLDFRYADGAGDYQGTPFSISGSGALTLLGTPTAPTAAPLTSTTQLATTAFTTLAVGVATTDLTAALDTATDDLTDAFTDADALKANLASPTFTGVPAGPTAAANTDTTQLATTAYVVAAQPLVATIQDNKASTVGGGAAIVGMQTRTLNTVAGATSIVSLSSNEFTLVAGTYHIEWSVPAYATNSHQCYLDNVTDSVLTPGSSEYALSPVQSRSVGSIRVVLAATKVYRLRHYTDVSSSQGLGVTPAGGTGGGQAVYARVVITKFA